MSKKLKIQAKNQLKNNWPAAVTAVFSICICAIIIICSGEIFLYISELIKTPEAERICGTLYIAVTVIVLLLLTPVWLGFKRFSYIIAKGTNAEILEMFRYVTDIKRYARALSVGFKSLFRLLVIFGLLSIPAVLITYLIGYIAFFNNETLSVIYSVLLSAAFILALLLSQKYSLAHYIFFENEELPASACFSYARDICREQKYSMTSLMLSFFPWYLLLFLVLPVLYVLPYISVTAGNLAKWSIYNYMKQAPQEKILTENLESAY